MKIYDVVKDILENDIEARSSDKRLLWLFWKRAGIIKGLYLGYEEFKGGIPAETITRARRMVQNDHPRLQATEVVKRGRHQKASKAPKLIFDEVRQVYVQNK